VRSAEDEGWPDCVETWKLSVICCRLGGHIQERWALIVITGMIIVHIYEEEEN
jgi:hypothetical protein